MSDLLNHEPIGLDRFRADRDQGLVALLLNPFRRREKTKETG